MSQENAPNKSHKRIVVDTRRAVMKMTKLSDSEESIDIKKSNTSSSSSFGTPTVEVNFQGTKPVAARKSGYIHAFGSKKLAIETEIEENMPEENIAKDSTKQNDDNCKTETKINENVAEIGMKDEFSKPPNVRSSSRSKRKLSLVNSTPFRPNQPKNTPAWDVSAIGTSLEEAVNKKVKVLENIKIPKSKGCPSNTKKGKENVMSARNCFSQKEGVKEENGDVPCVYLVDHSFKQKMANLYDIAKEVVEPGKSGRFTLRKRKKSGRATKRRTHKSSHLNNDSFETMEIIEEPGTTNNTKVPEEQLQSLKNNLIEKGTENAVTTNNANKKEKESNDDSVILVSHMTEELNQVNMPTTSKTNTEMNKTAFIQISISDKQITDDAILKSPIYKLSPIANVPQETKEILQTEANLPVDSGVMNKSAEEQNIPKDNFKSVYKSPPSSQECLEDFSTITPPVEFKDSLKTNLASGNVSFHRGRGRPKYNATSMLRKVLKKGDDNTNCQQGDDESEEETTKQMKKNHGKTSPVKFIDKGVSPIDFDLLTNNLKNVMKSPCEADKVSDNKVDTNNCQLQEMVVNHNEENLSVTDVTTPNIKLAKTHPPIPKPRNLNKSVEASVRNNISDRIQSDKVVHGVDDIIEDWKDEPCNEEEPQRKIPKLDEMPIVEIEKRPIPKPRTTIKNKDLLKNNEIFETLKIAQKHNPTNQVKATSSHASEAFTAAIADLSVSPIRHEQDYLITGPDNNSSPETFDKVAASIMTSPARFELQLLKQKETIVAEQPAKTDTVLHESSKQKEDVFKKPAEVPIKRKRGRPPGNTKSKKEKQNKENQEIPKKTSKTKVSQDIENNTSKRSRGRPSTKNETYGKVKSKKITQESIMASLMAKYSGQKTKKTKSDIKRKNNDEDNSRSFPKRGKHVNDATTVRNREEDRVQEEKKSKDPKPKTKILSNIEIYINNSKHKKINSVSQAAIQEEPHELVPENLVTSTTQSEQKDKIKSDKAIKKKSKKTKPVILQELSNNNFNNSFEFEAFENNHFNTEPSLIQKKAKHSKQTEDKNNSKLWKDKSKSKPSTKPTERIIVFDASDDDFSDESDFEDTVFEPGPSIRKTLSGSKRSYNKNRTSLLKKNSKSKKSKVDVIQEEESNNDFESDFEDTVFESPASQKSLLRVRANTSKQTNKNKKIVSAKHKTKSKVTSEELENAVDTSDSSEIPSGENAFLKRPPILAEIYAQNSTCKKACHAIQFGVETKKPPTKDNICACGSLDFYNPAMSLQNFSGILNNENWGHIERGLAWDNMESLILNVKPHARIENQVAQSAMMGLVIQGDGVMHFNCSTLRIPVQTNFCVYPGLRYSIFNNKDNYLKIFLSKFALVGNSSTSTL